MGLAYVFTQYGGPEYETFLELPEPVPGPGQLLVTVRAAGVNPVDWKRRNGAVRLTPELAEPEPFGREVAGVVRAVGEGVVGFAPGDEVFGTVVGGGGYAEDALLGVELAAHKPPDVPFSDAATFAVASATAYVGLGQLDLPPGATLLISGIGGGVGLAAAQLAMHFGASVLGTASAAKKGLVESVGATHVAYGEGVADRVRIGAPGGVDALLDTAGAAAMAAVAELVADRSKIVSCSDGSAAGELGGGLIDRTRSASVFVAVATLASEKAFSPCVTEIFPFARAGEALAMVETGHASGKVVIEIS